MRTYKITARSCNGGKIFDLLQNSEDVSGVKPSRFSFMIGGWCVIFIVRARKEGITKHESEKKNGSNEKRQNYWCYRSQ